jgi:hypothetical protein
LRKILSRRPTPAAALRSFLLLSIVASVSSAEEIAAPKQAPQSAIDALIPWLLK